jgi:hypothetical protein
MRLLISLVFWSAPILAVLMITTIRLPGFTFDPTPPARALIGLAAMLMWFTWAFLKSRQARG